MLRCPIFSDLAKFIHFCQYLATLLQKFDIYFLGLCNEFINHYYNHLAATMNAESLSHLMLSEELAPIVTTEGASSDYQINLLLLERIRLMSAKQLESFFELLNSTTTLKQFKQFFAQG